MRLAYISFEHPAGIAGGGIGTYIGQISKLMADRGHDVEVFAGTRGEAFTGQVDGYRLHLIPAANNADFIQNVVPLFAERHTQQQFDLIESPEYGADALAVKKKFSAVPLVVKLHTPKFLISELNGYKRGFFDKLRFVAGGILRLQRINFYWLYKKDIDPEYELYQLADAVSSPSESLANIIKKKWGERKISVLPYPYTPSPDIVSIPALPENGRIVVAFIGKLEKRKGIIDVIKAIPAVLEKNNHIEFCFVGAVHPMPHGKEDIRQYAERKLSAYKGHLKFMGFQPADTLPSHFKQLHICLFPSIWENFPYVCLESMAAGKAVIGSKNGGMAEMITHLKTGYLIRAKSSKQIAEAVLTIAADSKLRTLLGSNAREEVLKRYNKDIIGEQTEAFYNETIAACNL